MMSGAKVPDFDAYGLFRAAHSHNPPQYSHIVGLSSHLHYFLSPTFTVKSRSTYPSAPFLFPLTRITASLFSSSTAFS